MRNLTTRRSIRKYADKAVSEELLNRLLAEAERTPTMGNLQLYSVIVTRSEEMKTKLAPAHFNQPMVCGAPVVLTFCADFRRTTLWAENRQAKPGYDNFLSFINASTDALLYCQTFCNLAEEEGLGTCFLGTTVYMPQMIIDTLQLPQLVFPVATITLGWPDEQPELSDRLREDIIPEMMKQVREAKKNAQRSKDFLAQHLSADELLSDAALNPEWDKDGKPSLFGQKMRELHEMQRKGADIFMSSFKMFKQNFPFRP